jgi:hypothetical protein
MAKDDDGDIDGAEDGELVGLLEQPAFSLEEGDGSINRISNNHPSNSTLNLAYLFRSSRMGLICRRGTVSMAHQQVRWR